MEDRQGLPRPNPGPKGVPHPGMPKQSTANWPGAPGPKSPPFNKVGFPEVKAYAAQDLGDDKRTRVGKKISKLVHEGESQDQAVATALSMELAGRLTESGGYIRKKKK